MSNSSAVKIYGKKNKLQTKIVAPKNIRVMQISWSPTGDVDEISFQFGGDGTEDIEIHEGEADTERAVGFVVNPITGGDEEEYEDGDEDE